MTAYEYKDGGLLAHSDNLSGMLPESTQTPFMLVASEEHHEYFIGSLDDVRVYNRPLTAGEVLRFATMPIDADGASDAPVIPNKTVK
jgi:hypothetical protein